MTDDELSAIVRLLGRDPTELELAMYSVMWSEHCSYKSSRRYLRRFPTEAPWVLVGPGEGAGVVDVGERPIALLDPLRFGDLSDPRTRYLFEGVVAGISGYGNAVGVPTVGGEVVF